MVAARETTLQELLEGSKQYQVPLYQRTYSWKTLQLERLWEDITKLADDRREPESRNGSARPTHFIGSLVLAPSPTNGPTGVQEFLIIDGQQRLTTLSVLLCAIRDHRAEFEGPEHRERINELYLQNKWKPGQQRLKLVPTQADRAAYVACLDATPQAGGSDPVGTAYRFFRSRLIAADAPDDQLDIERIEDAVISGLALVSVTAQAGDNAHRIFESLNNTGLRLTQGDLLRNYLFMRMPTRAEQVYHSLWLPLQEMLSTGELEQLFWLDLVQRDAKVKQTDIYAGQQARLDHLRTEAAIEAEVQRFCRVGALFKVILDPSREKSALVRVRLERLNAWGSATVRPLQLHLLERREQGSATSEQIADAMRYVESFLVRRLLIGRTTMNLNRILLAVVTEMDPNVGVDEAVRAYLSEGRKYYATDADLKALVPTLPYYLTGRPAQRALILRWLEESYGNKEPVELATLTIEHVLPQTATPEWHQELAEDLQPGEDFRQVHESLVHTLGNLTLSGYNSSLSNSPYQIKRDKLASSGLSMNQEIGKQSRWSRPQIQARGQALADRAATIWPGPVDTPNTTAAAVGWGLMDTALAELPAGSWTTYGDIAALIGSHPVPVGMRLATTPAPNAHRVLQIDGAVSPGFRWLDPNRSDDPYDLLRAEGVTFDALGRANPAQRLSTEDLAALAGISQPDPVGDLPEPDAGQDPALRDQFMTQIRATQTPDTVHGVYELLNGWVSIGGHLEYGTSAETSCFLLARHPNQPGPNIWPLTLYPAGRVEVVFQHLAGRPPFDDIEARDELRQRLNRITSIDLPATKLESRPGFDLSVLDDQTSRESLATTLAWFFARANTPSSSGT